jgi:hypothetical protein
MSDPFANPFGSSDPFASSDPFGDSAPKGRRGGLFRGLRDHVSSAHVEHLQDFGRQAADVARTVGGSAFDSAVDWTASNPDKVEKIGERVGQAAGAGMISPFIGGKAGKKAGKKLGGLLSKKAQERQSGGSTQEWDSSPSTNPFASNYRDPFDEYG